ncbi:hypothetical protein O3299_19845 [Janthinobacterium sp. SUN176]|uniref:hypothetical protein n=1 Tax=Janthinobacterium sp. SUN176 TaxID=3014788 RepID=UPI002713FED0|nr:hypothetical protein [Janthinobacterium sp. SUN176]MDO8073792.1 hypothetical protein [Janthinobacterium sp. SUN176]
MFYLNADQPSHLGGPNPTMSGWLYLAYDYHRLGQTKIGTTTRSVFSRVRQTTTNPYYVLFAAFHMPEMSRAELRDVEKYLAWKSRIVSIHFPDGHESEFLDTSPDDMLRHILERLPNRVSIVSDGEFDYTDRIYLPSVNPYALDLRKAELDLYMRFAAPDMYLEELRSNYRYWPERPNFVDEVLAYSGKNPYAITGPKLLQDRLDYDMVRLDTTSRLASSALAEGTHACARNERTG